LFSLPRNGVAENSAAGGFCKLSFLTDRDLLAKCLMLEGMQTDCLQL